MKKLTVIIALAFGIVSAEQEECKEGESCPAIPASGRSVLQKQQQRISRHIAEAEDAAMKVNSTANCDYQQCQKDYSIG